VLQVQGNAANIVRRVLSAPRTTVGVAARYWLTGLPADASVVPIIAGMSDLNNVGHCYVKVNPTGYLVAYRQDAGVDVQIGISAGPVVIANAWRHIETKFILDAVNGRIQVRIEGTQVLDTGLVRTTTNAGGAVATSQNVRFQCIRSGATPGVNMNVKDLIVWNSTGAYNNDFMGSCQVYKIIPDGDVSLNWTPTPAGTGFSKINETTPDDDAGYIAAPYPPPAAFKCSLSDLPPNVTSVRGVMPIYRGRKTDGGDGNIRVGVISGANTGLGLDRPISTAYTYWWDVFDNDPSGGAWSRVLVNALQLQLNRTV
jgi:hypothetical protein